MRARHREINIFNLSMLDVIAGAMAAFLIIMVVLIPYYQKDHVDYRVMIDRLQEELATAIATGEAAENAAAAARVRIGAAEAATAHAERTAAAERERAEVLARRLAKTFLVLSVRWDTADDVDLHVTDPSGAEFYFARRRIAGRPGELSEDTTRGPGNEVWEVREAPSGDYHVEVVLYAVKDRRKPVRVRGRLFHRDGSEAFPEVRLTEPGERRTVATINVDADGHVRLR